MMRTSAAWWRQKELEEKPFVLQVTQGQVRSGQSRVSSASVGDGLAVSRAANTASSLPRSDLTYSVTNISFLLVIQNQCVPSP